MKTAADDDAYNSQKWAKYQLTETWEPNVNKSHEKPPPNAILRTAADLNATTHWNQRPWASGNRYALSQRRGTGGFLRYMDTLSCDLASTRVAFSGPAPATTPTPTIGATTTTPCGANKHTFETGNTSEANVQPRWPALRWQSRVIAILILILILILVLIRRQRDIRKVRLHLEAVNRGGGVWACGLVLIDGRGETRKERAKLSEISSYSSNDSPDGSDDINVDFDGIVALHHHHEHDISNWESPPPFWELQTQPTARVDGTGTENRAGLSPSRHQLRLLHRGVVAGPEALVPQDI
ncbi:hypothetical protein TgHK011_008506 [Trichoderma gracile]|nr:hypothetical protein TgHK011_008506 [Trichoderma gracile]